MVEKIYNLVEILDRDVVKNGDGVTPFQFKLSYSDGKAVDLKDKRVYVSFASTTTYLFKKKAEVDSKGTISITLNDADPIIEGNTEIEISVESSNGKSQKFPSQDGEHSAFVYISKSIESLDSRVISTYTLKQFSDKIDILMDDLDKKYDDHLDNLKKDVGDYIDNSVEDKVDEIKAVAKESMDASIKASKDSIAASLTAENNVKANSTKATIDINKVSADATKKITDTSNASVATVNAKGDEVVKKITDADVVQKKDYYPLISGAGIRTKLADGTDLLTLTTGYYEVSKCKNSPFPDTAASWKNVDVIDGGEGRKMLRLTLSAGGETFYKTLHPNGDYDGGCDWWRVANVDATQNNKVTEDNGQFYYNLSDNEADILESVISESGFKTGYAHFTVLNGLGNNRSFRFTSYYYPTNGYIHAIDTAGQSHIRVCNGGVWGAWKSIADTSVTQNFKITNDDGSSITLSGFDLLNVEDVKNYDGYVTNPKNAPSSSGSGYFKRKYREGYIEITFAPHSTKDIYRNSYNGGTKKWVGWEKMVTSSELASVIGSNSGWLPLPLLNGVTASTPCFYRFYSTNGIYYLSFKGVLNTLPTRDVIIAKLPAEVTTKIDRPLTWVGNTSVSANTARFNRWVVEADGTIKFAISNFGSAGESGAWNPLDVTLTL